MSVRIIQGDVRVELPKLPSDIFDCIVTSPPYFGLRDYGTGTWEGGDPTCDHLAAPDRRIDLGRNRETSNGTFHGAAASNQMKKQFHDVCGKCGAKRIDAQIGLEPTLDAYLETMVSVCRELRRVLKPSGVFFLNIGDSYTQPSSGRTSTDRPKNNVLDGTTFITRKIPAGLKPKDLCLVPERLGIALQLDGWWVRSHIIWAKPNPMPESVTDRPTNAHETIWMLTKSARYFWDAEAVLEEGSGRTPGNRYYKYDGLPGHETKHGFLNLDAVPQMTRQIRNVWSVASHPFSQAHFATFPPEIVERCIKAGSSERGCCPACGAPWVRLTQTDRVPHPHAPGKGGRQNVPGSETSQSSCFRTGLVPIRETLGWQPSCKCEATRTPVPSKILDCFAGSGTTGLVSDRLGRDATLIDLNTSYIDMAVNRIRDDAPLFAEVAAE